MVNASPPPLRPAHNPYLRLMRLHQPVGVWLLLWPCWWGVALASPGLPDLRLLALFALGAVLMRSAGCIINDMADREFDKKVERTRTRPLASGELTLRQAGALLLLLLAAALLVALQMPPVVWILAAAALPLVAAYPFMKRITWWPQAFLGLTFNWGALMGWAAVRGQVEWPALLLYAGGLFWTLGYDTIYAHQDKRDDVAAGVKSTALRLGARSRGWVEGFYAAALLCWMLASLVLCVEALLVALVLALHMSWQTRRVDFDNPASCLRVFKSNVALGAIFFFGIVLIQASHIYS